MKKTIFGFSLFFIAITAFATGFDVKTSSVISQPSTEVLGEYQGSWYAIGFETPGNLNKPPQYRILKYSSGFKTGKTSELYPSFGEKTFYLKAAIINNKISLFYSRCELRVDEEGMMEKAEGRAVLPSIERQDFDLNTLEPAGPAEVIFDHNDERFAASSIEIVQSEDKSKTAVLIKPYYKYQKYKVIITDNATGQVNAKTFDFKETKEYLQFLHTAISNSGQVYLLSKVRYDVLSYPPLKRDKNVSAVFHLFSMNADSKEPVTATFNSPAGHGGYLDDPRLAVLNSGDMVLASDLFADEARIHLNGIMVTRYNEALSVTGQNTIEPSGKFSAMAGAYHDLKKRNEFANLELQKILPLEGKNFMLLTEYHASVSGADKNSPMKVERGYMITYRMDENLGIKSQHFIPKKQESALVDYAFSAQAYRKGNDVYLFYNDNWENDEEHAMNFKCTRLPLNGKPDTRKVLNTSNDFFISMSNLYWGGDDKVLFQEDRLVDYGEVTREVKLLEVTVR